MTPKLPRNPENDPFPLSKRHRAACSTFRRTLLPPFEASPLPASGVKTPRSILHLVVLSPFVSFERPTPSSRRARVSLRFDDGAVACDELAAAGRRGGGRGRRGRSACGSARARGGDCTNSLGGTRGRLAAAGFGKLVARDGAVVVVIVGTRARRRALAPSTGFFSGKSSRNQ